MQMSLSTLIIAIFSRREQGGVPPGNVSVLCISSYGKTPSRPYHYLCIVFTIFRRPGPHWGTRLQTLNLPIHGNNADAHVSRPV